MKKPRLCEILGVEVNENFKIEGWEDACFCVDIDGFFWRQLSKEEIADGTDYYKTFIALCEIIEHSELIIRLSKPLTYTEQEIAIMRGRVAEGLSWLTRDFAGGLKTFANNPQRTTGYWEDNCGCPYKIRNINLFPQITFENSPINMKEELMRIDESNKNPPPAQTGEGK